MLNAWHIVWDFLKVFWGSLEVKLPTIFMDTCRHYGQMEQQRWEESEKGRAEARRSEKRKIQRKEDAGARKGRIFAPHSVFPMVCGSGGSKSRLSKAAGAQPYGGMVD